MASAPAPALLPVSEPAAPSAVGGPPPSPSAFRAFVSRLSDSARRSLSNCRAWSELADKSAFSRPESLAEAASRLRKNLAYFRVNYAAVVAAVVAASLVAHPISLLVLLGLLGAWCLLYLFRQSDQPLVILGRAFSERETLGGLVLLTVVVVFLTTVGSLLISALMVGAALVGLHGAFRVPEDLFLDDQEPGGPAAGLLSFLGGAASNAAAAATVPAVAVRV